MGAFSKSDGDAIGRNKISVIYLEKGKPQRPNYDEPDSVRQKKSPIPEYYSNPDSGFSFVVKAGENNHFPTDLSSGK